MNKILLSGDDDLDNIVIDEDTELFIELEGKSKNINVIVEKDVYLSILELNTNTKNEINISLKENSRLIYNKASRDIDDRVLINLDGEGANVTLNSSVVNSDISSCLFEVRHNANNTISLFSNHGINISDKELTFKIDAYVPVGSKMCKTSQQNKIINTNCGKSIILPNLIIDTDDVDASHSAYIGNFDKEVMFYMKSRGLSDLESRKLLMNGFLIGNISYDEGQDNLVKKILHI